MIFMFKSFVVTFYHLWIQLQPTCYTAFMVIVLTLVGKTVIANIAKIYILQGVLSLVRKSIAKGIFQNATL